MIRTLQTGLMAASLLALSTGAAFADYELNILHINDFHSRIEAINKSDATCSAEEEAKSACFGGAARLLTAINTTRGALEAAGKNTLLLNAGDNFQGSLFYTTYKGATEAEVLNAMKFDAMTVGNHEFDDSDDVLATFLDKVQFPVVTANVVPSAAAKIGDRIKPSIVIDKGGQKIGIVGAVTNDTPEIANPGPNITIADDVAKITEAVAALKAQGVNKIIALTHVGYPRDLSAIAKIPDVDVVVGGHSHTLLSNTVEGAEGPYPTWVDNPDGHKVPVVQAFQYSRYLGDLRIVFDDAGVVKEATGEPILIDSAFQPDPALTARINDLKAPIETLKQKVVGETSGPIEGDRKICRARECSMGNLLADAQLDRVKDQGITIALQNGGGLRAPIDAGPVTMGEVLTVLPFQNTIATFQLTGADLLTALENAVSQVDDGGGRFLQVAGMKYAFDRSKPVGSRISTVEVKEGNAFVPIDPAKTYGVVTNNYVRGGGDGFKIFATNAKNAYDFGPNLEEAVAAYLGAHNPYTPYTEGRITDLTPADYVPPAKQAPAAPPAASTPATTAPAATAPAATAPSPATPSPANPSPATSPATVPAAPPATPPAPVPAEPAAPAAPQPSAPQPAAPEAAAPQPSTSEPSTPEPAPSTTAETRHVVVKGDTLWDIAKSAYGYGERWKAIAAANGNPVPERLHVGTELTLPPR
ncbi:5'-nucleotidase C-terminal domain-containing protein [Rhizobium sp. Leaf341]|uniref:5'-nucleotidase C-terminal domain-containing protein n=1 Tax=Rhizobium sp. Leaf341 TaxID=1736344 RepID=UPI000713D750|nr:5'-nucleotidase C-terminal domain-containing protein [Rhizobium sp. Leaf341]KQR75903.1 multifunctional 2',3'-cyclic-nucleotide 2'-phosphodiesterase/5'-nucleotidase/3'-nucleotidase [Rhizobium sp. Leaf341]